MWNKLWMIASAYVAAILSGRPMSYRQLRDDVAGAVGLNPGSWAFTVIMIIVVVLIVAALMGTLVTSLGSYAGNETTFGPILVTLVPLLIGAGMLLVIVASVLPKKGGVGGK